MPFCRVSGVSILDAKTLTGERTVLRLDRQIQGPDERKGYSMKSLVIRAAVALTASVGLSAAVVANAGAAPTGAKNASPISISCDNNQSYDAVVNGGHNNSHQTFNPAHDINSTSLLVPTAFGTATITVTNDSNQQVVDTSFTPAATKGNSQGGGTPLNCTFVVSFTFTTPSPITLPDQTVLPPGTYTQSITGTVTGFIPSQS